MGILDYFGGNSGGGSGLLGNMDDPQSAGLLGLAQGLLAASGPSLHPIGFGQAVASGLQGMQANRKAAFDQQREQMQMDMLKQQVAAATRKNNLVNDALEQFNNQFSGARDTALTNNGTRTLSDGSVVSNVGPTVESAAKFSQAQQSNPMLRLDPNAVRMDLGFNEGKNIGQWLFESNKPTDFTRQLQQAQIDPNSPEGINYGREQVRKLNYIAPTRLGEGYYNDPNTGVQSLPNPKSAYATVRDPSSPTGWRTVEQPGGVAAVQGQEKAEKLGRTLGTLGQGVDEKGNSAYFLGLPPGTVGAPSGQGAGLVPSGGGNDAFGMLPKQTQDFLLRQQGSSQEPVGFKIKLPNGQIAQGTVPLPSQQPQQPSVLRPANAPGYNASQETLTTANAKRYNDLLNQASDSSTRVNVYDNILNLSRQGVSTGPGAAWQNSVKGYIANTPILSSISGKWKDDVSGFQELNKFLYQNAQRNWQAAGGTGTDAQLAAFTNSNPNDKMFPQALQAMAQWGKAGELALQAKTNAAQNFKDANGGNVANLDQFERQWRNNFDPRVFQLNVMTPDEQKAFVGNLSPADAQALLAKRAAIRQMGGF